jgi:trans-aconitate methyltransferase
MKDAGDVCEMGCGPGQVAGYLRDAGLAKLFGLDLSPRMVEQAQRLNPDISFQVGDMLALEVVHPDEFLGQPISMDFFLFRFDSILEYRTLGVASGASSTRAASAGRL